MQLRRFTSDSTSKALQAVREAFGDEAVILSNRQVNGLIEIIATGTFDERALASAVNSEPVTFASDPAPVAEAASSAASSAAPDAASSVASNAAIDEISVIDSLSRDLEAMSGDERPLTLGSIPPDEADEIARQTSEERQGDGRHETDSTDRLSSRPGEALGRAAGSELRQDSNADVMATIHMSPRMSPRMSSSPAAEAVAAAGATTVAAIGQVLAVSERRHAERARRLEQRFLRLEVNLWGELEPLRAAHLRQLVRLGVGIELAVRLVERVTADMSAKTAMRQSLALLKATLPIGVDGSGREPGVTVLSGPAGGGKTTALVKLATQHVRLHGAQSTVLIAADSRRIGAFESLQAYGRLLGVPVVQARDADELDERIAAFAHKPLVLVDHVPLGLGDSMPLPSAEALGECEGKPRRLRRLLVLPATLEPCAFETQVAAHMSHGIGHAVLTHVDRAPRLASCFAPLVRHALPIAYVSDERRVLTPLAAADASHLVATAMTLGQRAASNADEELLLNLLQPTREVIDRAVADSSMGEIRFTSTTARSEGGGGRRSVGKAAGTEARSTVSSEAARGRRPEMGPGGADGKVEVDTAGSRVSRAGKGEVDRSELGRGEMDGGELNRGELNRGELNRSEVDRDEVNRSGMVANSVDMSDMTIDADEYGLADALSDDVIHDGELVAVDDDSAVRPGTLERIVAFEVVDDSSVLDETGAFEISDTGEVLDVHSPEGASVRRTRAERRSRRDVERSGREEIRR